MFMLLLFYFPTRSQENYEPLWDTFPDKSSPWPNCGFKLPRQCIRMKHTFMIQEEPKGISSCGFHYPMKCWNDSIHHI